MKCAGDMYAFSRYMSRLIIFQGYILIYIFRSLTLLESSTKHVRASDPIKSKQSCGSTRSVGVRATSFLFVVTRKTMDELTNQLSILEEDRCTIIYRSIIIIIMITSFDQSSTEYLISHRAIFRVCILRYICFCMFFVNSYFCIHISPLNAHFGIKIDLLETDLFETN